MCGQSSGAVFGEGEAVVSVARPSRFLLVVVGLLALDACAPYRLQPLVPSDVLPGIRLAVKTTRHDFFLDLVNRSNQLLSVTPSAIELFFNGDRLQPEEASPPGGAPPGGSVRVKLTFDADLFDPHPDKFSALLLEKGVRLGPEPAGIDAVRLTAKRREKWEPERNHFSVVTGFAMHHFYGTPFFSGFAEFRLGGLVGQWEITARPRLHLGKTRSGLPFFHGTAGLGVLRVVHPRVRVGGVIGFLPSYLVIDGATSGALSAFTYDVHAELVADLLQRAAGAMILSTRVGMTADLFGASRPYMIGPSLLVALGYRFP